MLADSEHVPSLIELGNELSRHGNPEGKSLIKKAHKHLVWEFDSNSISENDCHRLRLTSSILNDKETLRRVEKKLDEFATHARKLKQTMKPYDEKNLLVQGDLNRLTQSRLI